MLNRHIAFYKPYGVICQFTGEGPNLSEFGIPKDYYAAGRLDKDSEGLLILTQDGVFNQKLTHPKFEKYKTYLVQVERIPSSETLDKLRKGVIIKGGYHTLPAQVKMIDIDIPPRTPPIRERKSIPTCWLELVITEGKNRQVRSMTASVGHPTLRLIRSKVGKCQLEGLQPGQWRYEDESGIL